MKHFIAVAVIFLAVVAMAATKSLNATGQADAEFNSGRAEEEARVQAKDDATKDAFRQVNSDCDGELTEIHVERSKCSTYASSHVQCYVEVSATCTTKQRTRDDDNDDN